MSIEKDDIGWAEGQRPCCEPRVSLPPLEKDAHGAAVMRMPDHIMAWRLALLNAAVEVLKADHVDAKVHQAAEHLLIRCSRRSSREGQRQASVEQVDGQAYQASDGARIVGAKEVPVLHAVHGQRPGLLQPLPVLSTASFPLRRQGLTWRSCNREKNPT